MCVELIPARRVLSFTGLQLQLQRSWLSIMTTVPSAGTPCRLRGNCPVDIFSTSRSFRKGHWDCNSVQATWELFVLGLKTNPSTGVGALPQTGRGALQDFEERAKVIICQLVARVECENRSLEWRIQRRDRPAFLDDSTTWIFRQTELERKMVSHVIKSYWRRVMTRSLVDDHVY